MEGAALEACYQHDNGFNFRASACSLEFIWDLTGQSVTAVNLSVKANKFFFDFLERRASLFDAKGILCTS